MASPIGIVAGSALGPFSAGAEMLANEAAPIRIPEPGALLEAFAQRRLSRQGLNAWMLSHGILLDPGDALLTPLSAAAAQNLAALWDVQLQAQWTVPSPVDAFALANRGKISAADLSLLIDRSKLDPRWKEAYLDLQRQIPGPSDLVTFMVRDVWSVDVLTRFGYTAEYPAELEQWLGAQGLAYPIPSPKHDSAGLGPFSWAKAYWWSHWQLPSPSQGIEMVQRLRGRLGAPGQARDPSGLIFDQDDLDLLLKTADYPPFWRDRLAAIGYRPIGIRNLRALWRTGLADEVEVTEVFQDQGYTLRDSVTQARLIATEQEAADLLAAQKARRRQLLQAFELGLTSLDELAVGLYSTVLSQPKQLAAWQALGEGARVDQARANNLVLTLISQAQLAGNMKRVGEAIRNLKGRYLKRQLRDDQADQLMQQLGIDPGARASYLASWKIQVSAFGRLSSPGQVVRWFTRGLLDANTAAALLAQWGYDQDQIDLILVEANLDQVGKQARVLSSLAQAGHRVGRQLAQAVAAQQRQLKAAQAALARSASPAALRRWAKEGLINGPDFAARLASLGVGSADVGRYLDEAGAAQAMVRSKEQAAIARAKAAADRQAAKTPRRVPIGTLRRWLKKDVIDEAEFTRQALALGYAQADVDRFVAGG